MRHRTRKQSALHVFAHSENRFWVSAMLKPLLIMRNDVSLFLRRNWFNRKRKDLDVIVRQFHEFAEKYSPGSRIRFVYTHLQSKFLSQQPDYKPQQSELEHSSRFNYVEKQIISEVVDRGKFLRWKSFIDGAVVPMLEFSEKLLDFSAQNSSNGRVLIDKHRQVKSWSDGFRKSGQERIDTFIKKEMDLSLATR